MSLLINTMVSVFAAVYIYVNWNFNIWFWSNYSPKKEDSKFKIMFKKNLVNILCYVSISFLCFYSLVPCFDVMYQLGQKLCSLLGQINPELMSFSTYLNVLRETVNFFNDLMMNPYITYFFMIFCVCFLLLSLYFFESIYNEIKNESFIASYKITPKYLEAGLLISFFLLVYILFSGNLLIYFIGCIFLFFIFSLLTAFIDAINYELFYSGIQKKNFSKLRECMIIYSFTRFCNFGLWGISYSSSTFFEVILLFLYRNKFYKNNEVNYDTKIMNFFRKSIYLLLFIFNLITFISFIFCSIVVLILALIYPCFISILPHCIVVVYIYIYVSYLIMSDALSELKYNKSYYFEEE